MALSANSVFEVRTAGNDTNGGGFVTGAAGTDYSQQDAKNTAGSDISTTDAVANGTTTLTSATANFGTTIVGNIIYLQGGTGTLGASRYQVTARASTTSITLDRTVAAGTGITMNIGGAFASLGIVGSATATILVDGNKIYIKAGTYSITSSSSNVSAGCFNKGNSILIEGYQTTRGDLGTPPLLQASGGITSFTLLAVFSPSTIKNITLDGANLGSGRGFGSSGASVLVYKCNFKNFQNNGTNSPSGATRYYYCTATGCSFAAAFHGGTHYNCVAYSNTFYGFRWAGAASGGASRCLSYSNTGGSTDGFIIDANADGILENCISYGNGRDGFRLDSAAALLFNCIAESNTGIGFRFSASNPTNGLMFNCAGYSAGTNVNLGTGAFVENIGFVTGSGSFFTNAASKDFSLNATAGAGAALKAVGLPGIFPLGLTTGYLDIGAAQHQDAGGGGGGSVEHSAVF